MSAPPARRADASFFDPGLLRRFGITRVGDVTGLDIIGIPVWFAVRPNSRGLSVSQGKGLFAEQARLSAIMEAIEGAVAEDTRRHIAAFGSIDEMRNKGAPLIPFETVGRIDPDALDQLKERAWVKGTSVRRQQEVLAPYELVGMDFRADFPWDRQAFRMSSQGLAAGFDHDHAVFHALLELIENDACFLVDTFETRALAPQPLVLAAGVDPSFDDLIQRLSDIGLPPSFFDLTNALGVPVVMASLPRSLQAEDGPATRSAAGAACRPSTHAAAMAALLEAIQSRLTDISGARDDLSPLRYRRDMFAARPAAAGLRPAEPPPLGLDFTAPGNMSLPSWHRLAEHLFACGIEDVYVFPLETEVSGLHVVRVLASGLAPAGGGLQHISPRTLDHLLNLGGTR
ncbi:YcaO-like family protein [Agrobacterium sp. SOY23]|uniref:YcaO-like family protein n=1 Tax=Agrobacterium sp. SOY23 TaxID=3014555 RepID=UPI0022B02E79|nr:YcaO-like family protein [Agrobacterium sp. SOY23]MCZ4429842.1 YcaO-like family protein [Agrobacterium sp. SOY23]